MDDPIDILWLASEGFTPQPQPPADAWWAKDVGGACVVAVPTGTGTFVGGVETDDRRLVRALAARLDPPPAAAIRDPESVRDAPSVSAAGLTP